MSSVSTFVVMSNFPHCSNWNTSAWIYRCRWQTPLFTCARWDLSFCVPWTFRVHQWATAVCKSLVAVVDIWGTLFDRRALCMRTQFDFNCFFFTLMHWTGHWISGFAHTWLTMECKDCASVLISSEADTETTARARLCTTCGYLALEWRKRALKWLCEICEPCSRSTKAWPYKTCHCWPKFTDNTWDTTAGSIPCQSTRSRHWFSMASTTFRVALPTNPTVYGWQR